MSFKENFPSFKNAIPQDTCRDCDKPLYCEKIITDNCIDKQKVKEAIINCRKEIEPNWMMIDEIKLFKELGL